MIWFSIQIWIFFLNTRGGWKFQGENRIYSIWMFSRVFYAGRAFKEDHDVSAMIYPPNILYFVDKNKGQIVTKFAIVLFNTQVKHLSMMAIFVHLEILCLLFCCIITNILKI